MSPRLALAALFVVFAFPAFAEDATPDDAEEATIAMVGNGKYEAPADAATIIATLAERADTPAEAQSKIAADVGKGEAALAALRTRGVAVSAISMRDGPWFAPMGGTAPKHEFEARREFRLTLNALSDGNAIASALAEAGFRIQSTSLTLKDPRKAEIAARKDAIRDAREKAQDYADALGLKVGDVVSVTNSVFPYLPENLSAPLNTNGWELPSPAIVTVTANVKVVWRVEEPDDK